MMANLTDALEEAIRAGAVYGGYATAPGVIWAGLAALSERDCEDRILEHREPVFRRDLRSNYDGILRVLGWICPGTCSWIEYDNAVETVLGRKP